MHLRGEVFEITLNNWNICNQFTNGDPPVQVTAQIQIITSPPAPVIPVVDFCVGDNLSTTVGGVGIMNWYTDVGLTNLVHTGNPFDPSADPLGPDQLSNAVPGTKTYYVTATAGTCVGPAAQADFEVFQNPVSSVGAGFSVCTGSATLNGNDPTPFMGLWTTAGPATIDNDTQFDSGVTGLVSGMQTFTWTITNGPCTDPSSVIITRDPLPSTADAGPDIPLCLGTSTFMDAAIPAVGTGTWTITSPAITTEVIVDLNDPKTQITGLIPGITYDLDWEVDHLTCMPPTIPINNDQVQIIIFLDPPADAGSDIDECPATITLMATNPPIGSGMWTTPDFTGGESFVNPALPQTDAINLIAGTTYTLTWTVTNGVCISSDVMSLTRSLPPDPSNAGPDQPLLCAFSTTLAANAPISGTGLWTLTGVGTGTFADATDPSTVVSNLGLGLNTFAWIISTSCGANADFVDITNNAPPLANAGPDQILCNNIITTTLAANDPSILDATSSGSWAITSGVGGSFTPSNADPAATFDGNLGETYLPLHLLLLNLRLQKCRFLHLVFD